MIHLDHGEKKLLLLRRHWIILVFKLLFWVAAALVPVGIITILYPIFTSVFQSPVFGPLVGLGMITYYLFVWLFLFNAFVDYYLDMWIVTNERIINIELHGLFHRAVSEQKLFRIQDVTSELKGVFPTFLNYGTVYIQTAGEQARFTFKQIPDPHGVAKKIVSMVEMNKKFHQVLNENDTINT